MRNITLWFVLALSLVATSPRAEEAALSVEVTGENELVREKGRFRDTFVHPDADFTRYSKLYLEVADLQFREVGVKNDYSTGKINDQSVFALNEQEQEKYRQVVTDAFVEELGRSKKFELVDSVGPDTLIVRASILDIACYVPPNNAGRVDTYLSTVGEGTLGFDLIDSETGMIQARLEERSKILPPGRAGQGVSPIKVYRETMWRDIVRWSGEAARDLRRVLETAQSGKGLK